MYIHRANPGAEQLLLEDPYVRMGSFSKILHSQVEGNLTIDTASCINRCEIGRYFGMGCFSYAANSQIGKYCTFGARVSLGAFSHPTDWLTIHEFSYRNTTSIYGESIIEGKTNLAPANTETIIGSDVWIGDNASVRCGVSIGHGAIIGLGAIVVSDVPDYAIMVGNPARIMRYRFDSNTIESLLELAWWEYDMHELRGIDFSAVQSSIASLRILRGL